MRLQSALGFGVLTFFLLAQSLPGRAQEEPEVLKKKEADKKAMEILLQRADDEYRIFFRRPDKVAEYWAAIKFEVGVGKFELAGLHLKQLLQKEPAQDVNRELFQIEEVEGLAPFLRLQTIRTWSSNPTLQDEMVKNVDTLIDRVTAALEKYLSNPERIDKFIKKLDAGTAEERAFAFVQLNRARARAVPYLVEALRTSVGTPLHGRLIGTMLKLDRESVPPLLEVLKAADSKDAQDLDLRMTIMDLLKRRGDKRAVPYLWHLSSARMYPVQIRDKAKALLAYLLETEPARLPDTKIKLTSMAENYYRHQVRFEAGRSVEIWTWDGRHLAVQPVQLTPSQAEEFFGLRHAREALDLDPSFQPAQVVMLNLLLERSVAPNLDQVLLKPVPAKLQQLLATIEVNLLVQVLERSLDENNVPVALAALVALGERGDGRAARLAASGKPSGVARALYYPDRRVQIAAVKAFVRMPSAPVPALAVRVVEVLRRFLNADASPKIMVAYIPADKTAQVRQTIKDMGFNPVFVGSAKEIFGRLAESSDYDAVVLGSSLPVQEFTYLLTNLGADADQGRLPVLVFAATGNKAALTQAAAHYPSVKIYADVVVAAGDELKTKIDAQIKELSGAALTPAERKEFARVALDVLWRMSRGELQGYDLRPAQETIVAALRNPDMTLEALEILGRLPGHAPQARLAAVVLNVGAGKQRTPAAIELNRHIQKFGLMLDRAQTVSLQAAYQNAGADTALRAQLALLIGSMRPTPQATGARLHDFRADPPAQAAEKKGANE